MTSNMIEQISFVALGPLAQYFDDGPATTTFSRFAADKGRSPKISTFAVGSAPQTVLDYRLRKKLQVDPSILQLVYQGASEVQRSLLTRVVDGAVIGQGRLAPLLTRVKNGGLLLRV